MSGVARVLDCDGTITDLSGGTLLERLMKDYCLEQKIGLKTSLYLRAVGIKTYKIFIEVLKKLTGDNQLTGETNSLKLFDVLMLRKAGITTSFMEDAAEHYSNLIKPEHVELIKKCSDDMYIVSSEPVQLLEAVLKKAGIKNKIVGVYGTKFEIENGVIKRMDRSELIAGVSGKNMGMADIVSNGYTKIYAIGDSAADIGLFKTFRKRVVPYTFVDASPELVEYVKKNKGKIITHLEEFFANS